MQPALIYAGVLTERSEGECCADTGDADWRKRRGGGLGGGSAARVEVARVIANIMRHCLRSLRSATYCLAGPTSHCDPSGWR